MAQATPIQTAFNGGKFGRRLKGRSDLTRYKYGCEDLQNFIATIQGPAIKRSGTRFVKEAIDPDVESRLIPFEVSDTDSYILEIGVGRIRMFRNNGAVLGAPQNLTGFPTAANPVSVPLTSNPFLDGDSVQILNSTMTELNGRFFTVTNALTDSFDLLGENGTGRTTGTAGTATAHYDIVNAISSNSIPWLATELSGVQFVQNGDEVYLAHPNHPPHIITRILDNSWTCLKMTFNFPPLEVENTYEDITLSIDLPTVGTGRVITGVGTNFTAADEGRRIAIGVDPGASDMYGPWVADLNDVQQSFNVNLAGQNFNTVANRVVYESRVYTSPWHDPAGKRPPTHEEGSESDGAGSYGFVGWGWGYATVTAVTNTTTMTVTVEREMPVSCATNAPFSTYNVAPTDRWAWGAWDTVNKYPAAVAFYEDRLWFGGTEAEPQTVWASQTNDYDDFRITPADLDDTGLQFTFLSDRLNQIRWMVGDDLLFAGTDGGEFSVDSGNAAQAITPLNIRVLRRSSYGSSTTVQPTSLASSLVFARKNADLREMTFSFDTDSYVAPDLTQFSNLILRPGVKQIDAQPDPFSNIWAVKTDGAVAVLTFARTEDVIAWSDIVIGGTSVSTDSLAVVPHPDGDEDQVWFCNSRSINGVTKRYIEYLEKPFEEDDLITSAFFVDSGLSLTTNTSMSDMTGVFTIGGNSAIYFGSNPTGIFEVGDTVEINGISTVDFPIDAAALNGVRVLVTGVAANNISVENAEGEGLDLSGLPTPGGYVGPGTVSTVVQTITGLWHLEGETVVILADGARLPDQVVALGQITLPSAFSQQAHVGLQMGSCKLRTLPWNSSASTISAGTSQGWLGRVSSVVLRVDMAGNAIEYGSDFTTMDTWERRTPAMLMGSPPPLYVGDSPILEIPGGFEQTRQVAIRYDEPLPLSVLAIIAKVETETP